MFIGINGYEPRVLISDFDDAMLRFGGEGDAYDGTQLSTVRARKRVIGEFTTQPMSRLDAIALRGLLEGLGHHWSFDDATDYKYSSKGLAAATAGSVSHWTDAVPPPVPKFGTGAVAMNGSLAWETGFSKHYTMMVWKWSGAAWVHYVVRDDGAKWVDGVRNDAASTTFLAMDSDGTFTLSGAVVFFDDAVVFPFRVSTDMAVAFGTATSAFSDLPKLHFSGDIIPESTFIVGRGLNPSIASSPCMLSGTWTPSAASVQFSIREG